MNKGEQEPLASYSEIDSDRFGIRVARADIRPGRVSEVLEFCAAKRISLLIARCTTTDLNIAQEMEARGFFLMDSLLYYSFEFKKKTIPEDLPKLNLRRLLPGDYDEVKRVAAESFKGYYGHYHADRRLDRQKCDEGYVSWAERSCTSKNIANEVIVAERDGKIVGFATLRINNSEEGEGVLFAVAPEAQGIGTYRSFMVAGMRWCEQQGANRMIVSTQVNNVAVQKVWCRVGFEPAYSYYTFHKWFD